MKLFQSADLFSIIKHRNNQQQNQRLNHKSSHIKRKKIADFESVVNTIQINRESNGKNYDNQNRSLNCQFFIFKPKVNNQTGKN